MRRWWVLIGAILLVAFVSGGCAKEKNIRVEPRIGFSEVPVHGSAYQKKAAIALKPSAQTPFGRQAEDLLLRTLIETIDGQAGRMRLLSARDESFPDYMKPANPFANPQATFEVSRMARLDGFHCLLQAALLDIRPQEKKKGIWWFRKTKYYLNVVVALDLYDTFTAAKISSQVMEKMVGIDLNSYENFQAGMPDSIEKVDDVLVDMARDIGKQAAREISTGHWMAAVAAVQGQQISLATGRGAGLGVGDRLSVFEGRRVVDGMAGEKFIVPGYRVADIQVTAVEENRATASAEHPADIQPGDIAIPAP
ncbi:MAG: hypothetical protein WAU91_14795 [Desulfatitalea sp.]